MTITVLVVGRVKARHLIAGVAEYEERASRYWKLVVEELPDGAKGGKADPTRIREAEAERILASIPPSVEVVALTRGGERTTSPELARWLGRKALQGEAGVCFVIGGAYGMDRRVLDRAGRRLSLSSMTFPHEIARLVLAEQLYRAGTILRNEPYHKGD